MKKLPYEEGTWFAVPLEQGGFATGVIARMAPKGKLLFGYFFGPRRADVPKLKDVEDQQPKEAVSIDRFGDFGLYKKTWPIIGKSDHWIREIWPMIPFYRIEPILGKKYKIIYDNQDPSITVSEVLLPDSAEVEWTSGLAGSGLVEVRLSRLLGA